MSDRPPGPPPLSRTRRARAPRSCTARHSEWLTRFLPFHCLSSLSLLSVCRTPRPLVSTLSVVTTAIDLSTFHLRRRSTHYDCMRPCSHLHHHPIRIERATIPSCRTYFGTRLCVCEGGVFNGSLAPRSDCVYYTLCQCLRRACRGSPSGEVSGPTFLSTGCIESFLSDSLRVCASSSMTHGLIRYIDARGA